MSGDQEAGDQGAIEGMERALSAAGKVWRDEAYATLAAYVRQHDHPFVIPEARDWAYDQGLDFPPSDRAWGGVVKRAAGAGLIRRVGYRPYGDARMHTQPVSVWERAS